MKCNCILLIKYTGLGVRVVVFNATLNNISWQSVLLVEENAALRRKSKDW
jgi:hypothetical protein